MGTSINGASGGGAPSGAAGGDLGGTYPDPTVTSGAHHTHTSSQISDSTATGRSVLTGDAATGLAALGAVPTSRTIAGLSLASDRTAAAMRDAIAPKCSLGTAFDAGCSTSAYLDVAGTPSATPEWGPGQTLVALICPVATPTGVEILAMHADSGSAVRGWMLRAGDNAGARGELALFFFGLNGGAVIALPGANFGGALSAPHVLACAITAGKVVRYSWDGGAVQTVAALSGTYVPPTSGDPMRVGVSSATSFPSPSVQPVAMRAYSTVLSDADLVAVAAQRTSYRLADPSAGTLTVDLCVAQWWGQCSPASTVLDRADSTRRWRLVGALALHERA